jgi:hypothetical protein
MNTRSHSAAIVIAAATVALLFLLTFSGLVACGGSGGDVDPQTVLAAASAKMKAIKGFHFEYEVHQPEGAEPSKGLYIARIIGEVNAEGNMQATVDATMGGLPVSLGIVVMADTHYIQDPISQKWQSVAAAESPVGTLSLSAGTIRVLDNMTGASYKGTESKGGVQTYHITGMLAAEDVESLAGAVDTTDPFPADIWVGVDDNLVYEVRMTGAATANEDEGIWRSIILSDHDISVEIEAPQ